MAAIDQLLASGLPFRLICRLVTGVGRSRLGSHVVRCSLCPHLPMGRRRVQNSQKTETCCAAKQGITLSKSTHQKISLTHPHGLPRNDAHFPCGANMAVIGPNGPNAIGSHPISCAWNLAACQDGCVLRTEIAVRILPDHSNA